MGNTNYPASGVPAVRLEDMRQTAANGYALPIVHDFLTLGSFVLETGGAFETEYLYERHKVLDHDYLAASGGEAAAAPIEDLAVANPYWGPERLRWVRRYAEDTLGFAREDPAVYATEQRNIVQYAAFYVDTPTGQNAVISANSSGHYLFLNGELVDTCAYGRVKGIDSLGQFCAVTFKPGRNLVMFKVRVGYIADGIDFSLGRCMLLPMAAVSGSLGVTEPLRSGAYFGTEEAPRQIFPCFAAAFADSPGGVLRCRAGGAWREELAIQPLAKGGIAVLRPSVPAASEPGQVGCQWTLQEEGAEEGKGEITLQTMPFVGKAREEHIFSDFHFDTTYHQEQRTYAFGAFYITHEILNEIAADPNFKAILSEVDYLHPIYCVNPKYREALRRAFSEGKAEADCFYNQPNDLTSSGEGFVRNLIYGQLYHRDVLGRLCYVYAPGDVFGHLNQMSQICAKGGCTASHWGKKVLGLDRLFWHISPDGTSLLHCKGLHANDSRRLGLKACQESSSGGRGTPPSFPRRQSPDSSDWMKDTLNGARFSYFSLMTDSVQAEDAEKERTTIEYTARDLTPHHAGVLLTRTDFKQANRLAEILLCGAEAFGAIAAWHGAKYPEKAIDKAWRQLLCAQHHDSVTGTNNEISFVDLMIEYREAVELAADVLRRATAYIAKGVAEQGKPSLVVFNPLAWSRAGEPCFFDLPKGFGGIVDAEGKEVPYAKINDEKGVFLAASPSLGYQTYSLTANAAQPTVSADAGCTIENEIFTLRVDPRQGGGIVSLYDKEAQREIVDTAVDGPANRIAALKEEPHREETQHEYWTTGQKLFSSESAAKVEREITALYQKLTVRVRMGSLALCKQEITLWKGQRRIDLKTTIEDYQGRDDLFGVTFPVALQGVRPVYEDRYAPHVCGEGTRKLDYRTHQYIMYSNCQVAPSVNWFDYGPTARLAFDDANAVCIGMSAVIRPETPDLRAAGDVLLTALAKRAIPTTPYCDVELAGTDKLIHFNEDLRNTDTRFVLSVAGTPNAYEEQLLAACGADAVNSFNAALENDGYAYLFTRDNQNILGKRIDVLLCKAASETALEALVSGLAAQLATGGDINLPETVQQVLPGLPDDYGVALLNRGTIACTAGPDHLLHMMLFHTAEVYGNLGKTTGGVELIPERKTHVFEYALYPHQGDYRKAQLFRRGMEYNAALIPAIAEDGTAALPTSNSYLEAGEGFAVTAFKAGGYPLANMKTAGSIAGRGFTLRGFETEGYAHSVEFKLNIPVQSAAAVDLLEENPKAIFLDANGFTIDVPGHSIETFTLAPTGLGENLGGGFVGAEQDLTEPTYIRSWEHDLGTMPMGYLAVCASIGREVERLDDTTLRMQICVANNHPDARAAGGLLLRAPEGFTLDWDAKSYDVGPNGMELFPLTVKKDGAERTGILRLFFEDDGQRFEDNYEFGPHIPDITLRCDGGALVATVQNFSGETITGDLAVATPFETWAAQGLNTAARGNIGPMMQRVEIAPNSRAEYRFAVDLPGEDGVFDAFYAVAKLMCNGRIAFAYCNNPGLQHPLWSGFAMMPGGSLKRLLEMQAE